MSLYEYRHEQIVWKIKKKAWLVGRSKYKRNKNDWKKEDVLLHRVNLKIDWLLYLILLTVYEDCPIIHFKIIIPKQFCLLLVGTACVHTQTV